MTEDLSGYFDENGLVTAEGLAAGDACLTRAYAHLRDGGHHSDGQLHEAAKVFGRVKLTLFEALKMLPTVSVEHVVVFTVDGCQVQAAISVTDEGTIEVNFSSDAELSESRKRDIDKVVAKAVGELMKSGELRPKIFNASTLPTDFRVALTGSTLN
jgi:hypothetical protein